MPGFNPPFDRPLRVISSRRGSRVVTIVMMACHLVCGEIDAAIDWYQKDIEQHRPNAPMIAFAGWLKPLRASPRWPAVARMMNVRESDGR